MPSSGLEEFGAVVSDYKRVASWFVLGTVAGPLADYVVKLGPPWPSQVPVLTSIAELVVLVWVFHFCSRAKRSTIDSLMRRSLVAAIFGLILYLLLSGNYVFEDPMGNRGVKGLVLRSVVKPLVTDAYTLDDALKGAEYRPERVWTMWSIAAMQVFLLGSWMISFSSLAAFVGLFVVYRRHHGASPATRPS